MESVDGERRIAAVDLRQILEFIAQDHMEVRDLLNSLRHAVSAGDGASARKAFLQFQIWEERHFSTEEEAMSRFGYPALNDHKVHHDGLRDCLADIGHFLLVEEPRSLQEAIVAYAEQTAAHVEALDRALQEFLQSQLP